MKKLRRLKMLEVGKDFKFRDDLYNKESGETVPIQILTGPYKDVIYRYIKIAVQEKEDGHAVLQFIYDLLELGEHFETKLRADKRFVEHLGLLLNSFILETLESSSDVGENYSEEPGDERGVHP
jgi:hypothetical protein